jgi:hypothetical protein
LTKDTKLKRFSLKTAKLCENIFIINKKISVYHNRIYGY